MKKLLFIVGLGVLAFTSGAQTSANTSPRWLSLLTGYNVDIPTNATVGYGTTNVLYTSKAGQILYSLTNNVVNGTLVSNSVAADAFQIVRLSPDALGNYNANAAVTIVLSTTNLIPSAVTNSFGQYFVTNWPLASSQYPNWMYPGTTNAYGTFTSTSTNAVTVNLYRAATLNLGQSPTASTPYATWETTAGFSFTVANAGGITNTCVITNLPAGFLQGAVAVKATVSAIPGGTGTAGVLLNALGIAQPQP